MMAMIEYVVIIVAVVSAIIALLQNDLLKAAILTGISGFCVAVLFQILLAPDVALTQASYCRGSYCTGIHSIGCFKN